MNQALLKSEKQDWNTPPQILELVRKVGPIALDPATTNDNPTGALATMNEIGNGLAANWAYICGDRGLTFVNPPYSRALKDWAAKFAEEGRKGCELITLTPARCDTRWWRHMTTADVICFWRGRIKFVGAPAPAPFPSAVCYWGKRPGKFSEVFEPFSNWMVCK
jgi:phage N-6-adenine-methyltransferase